MQYEFERCKVFKQWIFVEPELRLHFEYRVNDRFSSRLDWIHLREERNECHVVVFRVLRDAASFLIWCWTPFQTLLSWWSRSFVKYSKCFTYRIYNTLIFSCELVCGEQVVQIIVNWCTVNRWSKLSWNFFSMALFFFKKNEPICFYLHKYFGCNCVIAVKILMNGKGSLFGMWNAVLCCCKLWPKSNAQHLYK